MVIKHLEREAASWSGEGPLSLVLGVAPPGGGGRGQDILRSIGGQEVYQEAGGEVRPMARLGVGAGVEGAAGDLTELEMMSQHWETNKQTNTN